MPLSPNIDGERLKWQVHPGGKPCQTFWRVVLEQQQQQRSSHKTTSVPNPTPTETPTLNNTDQLITLELKPLTGRTHQLRVHCAAVGSGIEGDSLYGDIPIDWAGYRCRKNRCESLQLHACRLSFLHPCTGDRVEFSSQMAD